MSQDEQAVNDQVEKQETTTTESASVETKETEVTDSLMDTLSSDDDTPVVDAPSETSEESAEEESEEQADDTASEDETKQEQSQEEEKPLSPKAENRFQKLANENRELRDQLSQLHQQVYQPQTEQDLINEGLSPELAEVRALKQRLEVQDYTNRVYESQVALSNESAQVIEDFPIFDPNSKDYQADIAAEAATALEKVLIRDPNIAEIDPRTGRPTGRGQIIGSHVSPLEIYKPIADAYEKSRRQGQIQGQKATEKMLSSVDARGSITPKERKADPLLDILSSDD
ncbi:hypothetical protein KC963_00710 [Candidatus Saccharibacteria bacterium]|nr:hypothetical protein [Candidatus Saccharibacteria bacterium]